MTESNTDGIDNDFWTSQRARLLGSLIEKALATPQNYPLSMNALVAACNQTTNRDPITNFTESEVETLLHEAKADGLARFVHPRSGRGVTKYKQVVDEALGLEPKELALIGVLLLRGPQTVSELRARTERLASFSGPDDVEESLGSLASRQPRALTVRLDREPGHRERRWVQLLCPAQGDDRSLDQPSSSSAAPIPSERAPQEPPFEESVPNRAPDPFAVNSPAPSSSAPPNDRDASRMAELETEVRALRSELTALQNEFRAFKTQFD